VPPGEQPRHRPGRKAGALVVLVDGSPALYVERGGRTTLTFTPDRAVLDAAADALGEAVRAGRTGRLTIDKVDGVPVLGGALHGPLGTALVTAGFSATPSGLRLRGPR
jgi:ATP-dependent Lhr-like helicase